MTTIIAVGSIVSMPFGGTARAGLGVHMYHKTLIATFFPVFLVTGEFCGNNASGYRNYAITQNHDYGRQKLP